MRRCSCCRVEKALDQFYGDARRPDGLKSQCKTCHCKGSIATRDPERTRRSRTASARRTRAADPERFRLRERLASKRRVKSEKTAARTALNAAVRSGALQRPDRCQQCTQIAKVHGHHEDYGQPLQVRWLCPQCHADVHRTET